MIWKIIGWMLIGAFTVIAVMAHDIFKKLLMGRYRINDIEYRVIELFGLLFVLIIIGVVLACVVNM